MLSSHCRLPKSLLQLWLCVAVTAAPFDGPHVSTRDDNTNPNLGVLGDSWGSGVAYNFANTYDNNKDSCMRWNEAYAAQLEKDKGWSKSGTNSMQFVACSGSQLIDIVKGGEQLSKLSGPKDAIIMTSSGNNVGFFDVADACLFHSNTSHDYGAEYPADGDCKKAIDNAELYISGENLPNLKYDLGVTYSDMLISPIAEDNENVKFYQTSYARFFALDDWCNDHSFAIPFGKNDRPKLTKDVRQKINDLVDTVNDGIKIVTEQAEFRDKFSFIDINGVFETHRFCEPGSGIWEQYIGSNVWLWNIWLPFLGAPVDGTFQKPDDFATNPDYQFPDQTFSEQDVKDGKAILFSRGGNQVENGWRLRPFHPKASGYTAIKDAIIKKLTEDKIPGTVVVTSDQCNCNESSCENPAPCCANGTCPPP